MRCCPRRAVSTYLVQAAALRHKLDGLKREEAKLEARKCDLEARLFASEAGVQDPMGDFGGFHCYYMSSMFQINVGLASGRSTILSIPGSSKVEDLRILAQESFGQGFLRLVTTQGHILANPSEAIQTAGIRDGDHLTAIVLQPKIAATHESLAFWHSGGDRILTWGNRGAGGDSSSVRAHLHNIQQVQGISRAFAAILGDGSVVTWGDRSEGGDSSAVQDLLRNVQQVQGAGRAFAAILADGSVVSWGNLIDGGDSSAVRGQLTNVRKVQATYRAFAAIRADGSVVTWGEPGAGGDSSAVQGRLRNVQEIQATYRAFCAILADGSAVVWGDGAWGGNSSAVQHQLRNVERVQGAHFAFAAILKDGSVVTWGHPSFGGDSSKVQDQLRGVQQIQMTQTAFAAILADGSVVAWGSSDRGGDSSKVQDQLWNVQRLQSTERAFAALLADGSVITWGDSKAGGDSSAVQVQLKGVQQIQATDGAFAAILADGSVVTWGDAEYAGDSSAVQAQLRGVQGLHATKRSFAALLDSGSLVTWSRPNVSGINNVVRAQLQEMPAQMVLATMAQLRSLRRDDEEYRFFDITSKLLGCRRIRPYITCKIHWGSQETETKRSPYIEAENGDAYWGRKLLFPLDQDFWKMQNFKVTVEAFDKRELQGALRGDSLIGRAELNLDSAQLGAAPQRKVPLTLRGQPAGELSLQFQIQAPQEALHIMAHSSRGSLAAAAKAFAQTLRQQGALDQLLASRPQVMKDMPRERLAAIHNLLGSWLSKFCQQSLRMTGDETDTTAIDGLWQLARSAQEIIVCCTELAEDEDVPGIVVQWLRNYFSGCTHEDVELNETRLRALLAMHQDPSAGKRQIDPWARLQEYGAWIELSRSCARLPENSPRDLAFALASRLEEAARGSEAEVFTCEEIVQNGRLAPGMAAVVRRDPDSTGLHVFIYEHKSIVDWQAQCSNDPCTRCPLRTQARSRLAAEQLEVLSQREAASAAALDEANARLRKANDEYDALEAQPSPEPLPTLHPLQGGLKLQATNLKVQTLLAEIEKLSSPKRNASGESVANTVVHQGTGLSDLSGLRLPIDHPVAIRAAEVSR
eukprot:s1426_g7.t1